MEDFKFCSATKIIFGREGELHVGEEIKNTNESTWG